MLKYLASSTIAVWLAATQIGIAVEHTMVDTVGFVSTTALGNSDTYVGLALTPRPEYIGVLSSNPSVNGETAILTFSGPSWTSGSFANTYYIRFTSGALNGRYYTVSANDANTLTVDTNGDDLTVAHSGDTAKLVKFWTLETLFPKATQNTLAVSGSTLLSQRKSELLIPDITSAGINLATGGKFFLTSSGWKKDTSGFPDASTQILYPDIYIIIRHPITGVTSTEFTNMGYVPTETYAFALSTQTVNKQDNAIALARPVGVTLADSGLASGFVASTNTLVSTRRDELFIYDNTVAQQNRAPARSFFCIGTNWIENTTGFPNANTVTLNPGEAILIRKYQTVDGATAFSLNIPNYSQELTGDASAGHTSLNISGSSSSELTLSWMTADRRPYQLESSSDMETWSPFGSPIVGTGSLATVIDTPVAITKKFYRLREGAVRPGFDSYVLEPNDDGFTDLVDIGFTVNLFGQNYSQCYINNNGNITFESGLAEYSPYPLQSTGFPIIAPFWADVDTRAGGSEPVRYSYGVETVNGHPAFGVNYLNVGYYDFHDDKLNSFQLVLIDRSDTGSGNFDIEFNYNGIRWETGDASDGTDGYGGFPCRVGISNGNDRTIELAHSGETLKFLDTILNTGLPNYDSGLIYQMRNSTIPGRLVFQVRDGNVLGALQVEAGPDQTIPLEETSATLAGSASDPNGGSVTVQWALLSGPSGVSFSDPASLNTTVTFSDSGTYVIQLTASSVADAQIQASDTVTITR